MTLFGKIKRLLTRNKVVPHGVYIKYDGMQFDKYDKRFLNEYKLVESNFKNRNEEETYAKALSQVCPYCSCINDVAYRSISEDMLKGCFLSTVYVESFWNFYDEHRVKCPECGLQWSIVFNIDRYDNKYFGEL